jgi:hypothetical protein
MIFVHTLVGAGAPVGRNTPTRGAWLATRIVDMLLDQIESQIWVTHRGQLAEDLAGLGAATARRARLGLAYVRRAGAALATIMVSAVFIGSAVLPAYVA